MMTHNYVITGTSRGIGLEITKQVLKLGHMVYALSRSPKNSAELLELKEKNPDKLLLFSVDVNSEEQVSSFVKDLGNLDSQSPIDVLINNAGIFGKDGHFEKLSFEELTKTLITNALGPMRMTKALLPHLKKAKAPKVIHITSLMGSIAQNEIGGFYGYRMSKTALNMFHKSFSIDFPAIISLALHPGWVKTDMGGVEAPTTVTESVRGLLSVIEKATLKESGKFLDFEGKDVPW